MTVPHDGGERVICIQVDYSFVGTPLYLEFGHVLKDQKRRYNLGGFCDDGGQ